jgi:hypothetical protein
MKELSKYLSDLGIKYGVEADRVLVINHINSYFALFRKNIICYWDEDNQEFGFGHYDKENRVIKEAAISDFSFGTVRSLLWHIRAFFKTESLKTDWRRVKKIQHTVLMGQIYDIKDDGIHIVYYLEGLPIVMNLPNNTVTPNYKKTLKTGDIIPLYVCAVKFADSGIEVKTNPYSKKIPEFLIKTAMKDNGYSLGYLKCNKRVLGKFSTLVTDSIIDKMVIKSVSRILKERITIRHLDENEAERLFVKKTLLLEEIKIKRRRKRNAKRS